MSTDADLAELQETLAGLDGRPVAEHVDFLESLHGRLAAELDGLAIPRPEPRA